MEESKNSYYIPAFIIFIGLMVAGGIYYSKNNKPSLVNNNSSFQSDININPVSSTDHILGNPNAEAVIVEFSDTECPFCRIFQNTMQNIMNTYGKEGKVAWVYRHFPIDELHSKSRKEAESTECANELGGNTTFWKMLDMIYANTPSNNGLDASKLPEFAKNVGIDVTKFNECLNSGKYANLVAENFQDGVNAGARSTPYNVILLKTSITSEVKNQIDEYISKNSLIDSDGNVFVSVSDSNKKIVINGALPLQNVKDILDLIVK